VVGVIAVLGCLVCGGLSLAGAQLGSQLTRWLGGGITDQAMQEMIQQLNEGGTLSDADMQALIEQMGEGFLNGAQNRVNRGSIGYGETRSDRVGSGEQHIWTFNGNAGDVVVIEMSASNASDSLDPYLILYNPGGATAQMDDDSGGNLNSRIRFALPESGTYTIGAQSFAGVSSGSYELRLSR
jgi:hypothetical protein